MQMPGDKCFGLINMRFFLHFFIGYFFAVHGAPEIHDVSQHKWNEQ